MEFTPECDVNDIISAFDVTPATIRRDLRYLEEKGEIRRTHGKVHSLASTPIFNYEERSRFKRSIKTIIAKEAVKLVHEGDCIAIDSGTTMHALAHELNGFKNISIATNSTSFLEEASTGGYPLIMLAGGIYDAKNNAIIGPDAESFFDKISASIAFISTTGIRGVEGLTTATPFYAQIKQKIISCAKKCILLASSDKFTANGAIIFTTFDKIDAIITDQPIQDKALLQHLEACGTEVIVVGEPDAK